MNPDTGCWEWTGSKRNGYGQFRLPARPVLAHRLAYKTMVGDVPSGLVLDHKCHSDDATCDGGLTCPHRGCVNPGHLEPVTASINSRRGRGQAAIHAAKTHCKNGHEFTEVNTRIGRTGARICRLCDGAAHARLRGRRKAQTGGLSLTS